LVSNWRWPVFSVTTRVAWSCHRIWCSMKGQSISRSNITISGIWCKGEQWGSSTWLSRRILWACWPSHYRGWSLITSSTSLAWSLLRGSDEVHMHCEVVDVLGICCSYLRATHRPRMHWLWNHSGAHDEIHMHCGVVDVMVTCWSYLRATHNPWMHWLWSHVVLWISDDV